MLFFFFKILKRPAYHDGRVHSRVRQDAGDRSGLDPLFGIPYPVFSFAGLLPWQFFAGALSRSGVSLVGNANLITKVYFPRLVIPI